MPAESSPIRVTVIGGYLGAGKTTLVNHILRHADDRVAVLVNDFGDVNIDAELIEGADDDTITLANGCICCSLVDGFAAALETVRAADPRAERLVIEASGVADPATVAAYGHGPGLTLDATITVVDAEAIRGQANDPYIGDVVIGQLRSADLVVLNKADLVDAPDRGELRDWVADRTPAAPIEAAHGAIPLDALLGIEPRARRAGPSGPPADARFRTWVEYSDEPLDRHDLETRLHELDDDVVRVKGIVRLADAMDRRTIVHRVGRRLALTDGGSWPGGRSQLVHIAVRTARNDRKSAPG